MTMILYFAVLLPVLLWVFKSEVQSRRQKREWEAAEQFRNFQAFAVLKYHKVARTELRHLSIDDLRRDFNVSALYDEIGQ